MPYLKIISYEVKSSNAGVSNLAISFRSLDQVFKNDYFHVKKKCGILSIQTLCMVSSILEVKEMKLSQQVALQRGKGGVS